MNQSVREPVYSHRKAGASDQLRSISDLFCRAGICRWYHCCRDYVTAGSIGCCGSGLIPSGATYPSVSGGDDMHATAMPVAYAIALKPLEDLAVESCKHRMFAVLLWALRVHMISAAAKFSSASCVRLYSAVSG